MEVRSPRVRRPLLALPVLGLLALSACTDFGGELPTSADVAESPAVSPGDLFQQDLGPAIRAANRHTARLMAQSGVVGTAVGLNDEGEPAVRIFLMNARIPNLPDELDGIPVQRVVTGQFELRADRTARARPAPIGFSIGHPDITAGTLGARVVDAEGNVFALSNNHVVANNNNAELGDPILQPGPFDGGTISNDAIGTLADFEPFDFSGDNLIDAAIVAVAPNAISGSTPEGVAYGAPSTQTQAATLGMGVQKYGRTTGFTQGTVEEVNVTVSVCIEASFFRCTRTATFVDQISISDGNFSAGGDSGSLIVSQNENRPVGLLFAGSSTRTLANRIDAVLERFGVTIDPTVPGEGNGSDGDDGSGDDGNDEGGGGEENGGEGDDSDEGEGDDSDQLKITQFDVSTRTSGPWRRATINWTVSGAVSVRTELVAEGSVLASQTTNVSGATASGEHELQTRSNPDTVRIIVTGADESTVTKEKKY